MNVTTYIPHIDRNALISAFLSGSASSVDKSSKDEICDLIAIAAPFIDPSFQTIVCSAFKTDAIKMIAKLKLDNTGTIGQANFAWQCVDSINRLAPTVPQFMRAAFGAQIAWSQGNTDAFAGIPAVIVSALQENVSAAQSIPVGTYFYARYCSTFVCKYLGWSQTLNTPHTTSYPYAWANWSKFIGDKENLTFGDPNTFKNTTCVPHVDKDVLVNAFLQGLQPGSDKGYAGAICMFINRAAVFIDPYYQEKIREQIFHNSNGMMDRLKSDVTAGPVNSLFHKLIDAGAMGGSMLMQAYFGIPAQSFKPINDVINNQISQTLPGNIGRLADLCFTVVINSGAPVFMAAAFACCIAWQENSASNAKHYEKILCGNLGWSQEIITSVMVTYPYSWALWSAYNKTLKGLIVGDEFVSQEQQAAQQTTATQTIDVTQLTPQKISQLTPQQISVFTKEQVDKLVPEQIYQLTKDQVSQLTPDQSKYLESRLHPQALTTDNAGTSSTNTDSSGTTSTSKINTVLHDKKTPMVAIGAVVAVTLLILALRR